MNIYLPKIMYKWMPLFCISVGTIALFLPEGLVQMLCSVYLYVYGLLMIIRREEYK